MYLRLGYNIIVFTVIVCLICYALFAGPTGHIWFFLLWEERLPLTYTHTHTYYSSYGIYTRTIFFWGGRGKKKQKKIVITLYRLYRFDLGF